MTLLILVLFSSIIQCFSLSSPQNLTKLLIGKVIKECVSSDSKVSCFANKAAKIVEKSMDWDVTLIDGIKLLRNRHQIIKGRGFQNSSGLNRFSNAVNSFLNTHYFSVDLTDDELVEEARGGGGGGGAGLGGSSGGLGNGGGGLGGFGSALGYNRKTLKKEASYAKYAFMVLLGIFGLSGPIVMKTLAVMASKALIASKVALIIVASVALRKIFEKSKEEPSVKVIKADDYDRMYTPTKDTYWTYTNPYLKST